MCILKYVNIEDVNNTTTIKLVDCILTVAAGVAYVEAEYFRLPVVYFISDSCVLLLGAFVSA